MKMFELSHWQYDSISRWRKARPWSAPTKLVKVRVCNEHYRALKILFKQVVIVRMNLVKCLHMRRCDLEPVSTIKDS